MKVAICGAQCVGKSTFIEDIIAAMPEFTRPEYTYRDAIKDAGVEDKINRKTCEESQKIIFQALAREIVAAGPNTILDRSVMDSVAYTIWPVRYKPGETDITVDLIQLMKKHVVEFMEMYDLIVYIPVDESIPLKDDTFRDTDPEYRTQMAEIFEELLLLPIDDPNYDKYGYKVVTVSGTPEERVAQFKSHIKNVI